jgi:leucyl-tRNA synthetase
MSKSLGNTVDPEEMIQNYGADTVRLFMMFTAPPEQSLEWSDKAINGSYRFLKKLWKLIKTHEESIKDTAAISSNDGFDENQNQLRRKTHQTISKVTDDFGRRYTFNTAIAAVMELVNEVSSFDINDELDRQVVKEAIQSILLLLSPIAPHICHQLWLDINQTEPIIDADWPAFDPSLLKSETSLVVIQVNGKLRSKLQVSASINEDELKSMALSDEKVIRFIEGKEIKKVIVIPEKLVNIVV